MNRQTIQNYINNFRREISRILKPNIGMLFETSDCGDEGAIIRISFKLGGISEDKLIGHYGSISEGLRDVEQTAINGNIAGLKFHGTNMFLDTNGIIIIKDNSVSEWSSTKLKEDINKIIHPPKITAK